MFKEILMWHVAVLNTVKLIAAYSLHIPIFFIVSLTWGQIRCLRHCNTLSLAHHTTDSIVAIYYKVTYQSCYSHWSFWPSLIQQGIAGVIKHCCHINQYMIHTNMYYKYQHGIIYTIGIQPKRDGTSLWPNLIPSYLKLHDLANQIMLSSCLDLSQRLQPDRLWVAERIWITLAG